MAEGKEPPDEEKDEAAKDADGDVAMADGKEDGSYFFNKYGFD